MRTITLKADRELSTRGGYGIDRQLTDTNARPWVFWSGPPSWSSYVAVEREPGAFAVYSINGIGEIRWSLDPAAVLAGSCYTGDGAAVQACEYFFTVEGGR